MTDLVLSIAHGPNEKQAQSGLFNEYTLSLMWTVQLVEALKYTGLAVRWVNESSPTATVAEVNEIKPTLALEIHFNSFHDASVRGSETLYFPGSVRGKPLADSVQAALGPLMTPDRGAKPGWYQGREAEHIHFLQATNCTALIIEPGFIDQREELIKNIPAAVGALALVLERELTGCGYRHGQY